MSKQLVFPVKCSFNKQQFNLLSRFLHLISPSPLMIKLRIYVCPWTPKILGTIVLHFISMYIGVSGNQKNNTQDHNMVPHHITNWAQRCLIALSRREEILSLLYGCSFQRRKLWNIYDSSCYIHLPFPSYKKGELTLCGGIETFTSSFSLLSV